MQAKRRRSKRKRAPAAGLILILAVVVFTTAVTVFALGTSDQDRQSSLAGSISSLPEEESSQPPEPLSESEPDESGPAVDLDDWRLILVNAEHPIPDDFTVVLGDTPYGYQVDARIVDDLSAMIEGARADGISLMICSAYRTKERSQQLFDKQIRQQLSYGLTQEQAVIEAAKWVAPPGTSDHHTGLALDIVTPSYQMLNFGFADTGAAKWMAAHAHEYGFVLRFPEDKQEITGIVFEPWHFRYVGKEHAAAIFEGGLCLEEYVAQAGGQQGTEP